MPDDDPRPKSDRNEGKRPNNKQEKPASAFFSEHASRGRPEPPPPEDKLTQAEEEFCRRFHFNPKRYLQRKKTMTVHRSHWGVYARLPAPMRTRSSSTRRQGSPILKVNEIQGAGLERVTDAWGRPVPAPRGRWWNELAAQTMLVPDWARLRIEVDPIRAQPISPAPELAEGIVARPLTDSSALEKLPAKKKDCSHYLDSAGLTERQRQCASLSMEYGLSNVEIARRLGLNRTTVDEHIDLARKKLEEARSKEKRAKNKAKSGAP